MTTSITIKTTPEHGATIKIYEGVNQSYTKIPNMEWVLYETLDVPPNTEYLTHIWSTRKLEIEEKNVT